MTIPVPMQRELEMDQGDELEFVINGARIMDAHVLKAVRVDLLPDEVLESLKQRKQHPSAEKGLSPQELTELSEGKEVEVRTPTRAAAGG
jgi:bifunctional DNA-binding transcriptional regulator/antitoxin component of YhaV-PrlF toxin-antitoxin module